jgi:hypothetical protein
MKNLLKEVWIDVVELWKEDRREFWDLFGGLSVIILWGWITFGFLIPIFG